MFTLDWPRRNTWIKSFEFNMRWDDKDKFRDFFFWDMVAESRILIYLDKVLWLIQWTLYLFESNLFPNPQSLLVPFEDYRFSKWDILCTPWHFIIRTTMVIKFLLLIESFWDMFRSRHLPIQSHQWKYQNNFNDITLVSLLLALSRFHVLLLCFNCWLWTSKCRLGYC